MVAPKCYKRGWLVVAGVIVGLWGCASPVKSPVRDAQPLAKGAPAASAAPTPAVPEFHTVASGETLAVIARRYGVSAEELARLNHLSDPNRIFVGQQLRLRPSVGATASGVQVMPVPESGAAPAKEAPRGGRTVPVAPAAGSEGAPASTPSSAAGPATASPTPPTAGTQPNVATDSTSTAAAGAWAWPAEGTVLARFDGNQRKGIDIGGKLGDPVRAAADGRVSYVGEGIEGFGLIVIVQHPNDFVSVYAHNQAVRVKEGDAVKRGQVIATLGQSGNTDRPKLHFQVRKAGKAIDPETVLPRR